MHWQGKPTPATDKKFGVCVGGWQRSREFFFPETGSMGGKKYSLRVKKFILPGSSTWHAGGRVAGREGTGLKGRGQGAEGKKN